MKINTIKFKKSDINIYIYMSASVITMFFAFLTNWLMTKYVTPESFGLYKYATNFLFTIPAIFELGIHFSCSRIIAERNSDEKDGVVFTSVIVVTLIGTLLSLGLYLISGLSGSFDFSIGTLREIENIYPFILIFTLRILVLQVYQGTGKTNQLALMNLIQYLILIAGMLLGNIIISDLNYSYLIMLFCISWVIVMVPFISKVKYSFVNFNNDIKTLYNETKRNGFYVYLGTIVTTVSSSLIGLITGSLYGVKEYGYYSLALSFAQTFTVISSTMATVKFKENVNQKFIPVRDFRLMIVLNIIVYVIFLIIIEPAFKLFFSTDYAPTIHYLIILGLAYSLNGIILYFNRYFVARGLGSETTKNSFFVAVINIITAIVLIPRFEIKGLVYASLISSTLSLVKYVHSYRLYLNNINKK
ncbi:MAG: oligosaccharide flippase family protein [Clostridiales bacterium]|nr:oligosaccharide flippase family protein [Clostridiales bacterium]